VKHGDILQRFQNTLESKKETCFLQGNFSTKKESKVAAALGTENSSLRND
jgi:hypothetical protein